MNSLTTKSRVLGGLWGSVVGDALGVPVEFLDRGSVQADPVRDMRGYGTHRQPAGTWSDDTSLTLCTVASILGGGFDLDDLGRRFVGWYRDQVWTPHGTVFDIGVTTASALRRIELGAKAESCGNRDELSNGNGSLMRILPVVLRFAGEDIPTLLEKIHRASAITHGHPRSQMCCGFYALYVQLLLAGKLPADAFATTLGAFRDHYDQPQWNAQFLNLQRLLDGRLAARDEVEIKSSGYVVHTLEAAIFCLLTTDSFKGCVLRAVNLGGDTDTVGCVAGGLAGVVHGLEAIPADWRQQIARRGDLDCLFHEFADSLVLNP